MTALLMWFIKLLATAGISFLTWTAPRTWVPGELVTASMLNSHLRDNLNFLRATSQLSQTFRGLRLRTHPDADKSANQVMLTSCDELVTDLGTRVSPRSNLTADITVNGAGGLDTGSRVASTQYSIWYGFKGPTAGSPDTPTGPSADCIFLHRDKDYLLDQSQTVSVVNQKLRDVSGDTRLAQGFKVATVGPIEFIDLLILRVASPTGRIWAQIEGDSSGSPNGTALATSDKLDVSLLPTVGSWTRFIFRTPFTPANTSTQYHIVLYGDFTISATNYAIWNYDNANVYANGVAKKFDGAAWSALSTNEDFCFQIYVTRNDTAVTLPTGYTEKCLIGFVYNSAGNALQGFVAVDRLVRTLVVESFPSSTSAPVLQPLTGLPSRPIRISVGSTSNGANSNQIAGVPDGYALAGGDIGGFGALYASVGAASQRVWMGTISIEFQGVYVWVSGGTGTFYVSSYEW